MLKPVRKSFFPCTGILALGVVCASATPYSGSQGGADLTELLDGSTMLLATSNGSETVFQVNAIEVYQGSSPIKAATYSGSDLYYIAESQPGYYRSGAFQALPLKKFVYLNDIAVQGDTVHIAGRESDSLTVSTAGGSFLLRGDQKHVFPASGPSAFFIQKLLLGKDAYWAAGTWDNEVMLWRPDSLQKLGHKATLRLLAFANFRNSPLVAGLEDFVVSDMVWRGGWYWHEGVKHPIKYREDGRDEDPFDHLYLDQFLVSGDSLLAVGRPPAGEGSSYLWVNGTATPWQDSTVENEILLGIARSKGTLFLLGRYRNGQKTVLCLWARGVRVDLKELDYLPQVTLFKVVDAGGILGAVRPSQRGRLQKTVKPSGRRSATPLLRKAGTRDGTTADGRSFEGPRPARPAR